MKSDDLIKAQRAQAEAQKAFMDAVKRGEPIRTLECHRPITVEVSLKGEATLVFLSERTPDGTGLMTRLLLTAEATQTLRAKLLESESIPDGFPAEPDSKQAN
jgi:hypothetical protein